MALTDYAQKRAERIFVKPQSAVGVMALPGPRDAVKLRGGATLPATASDFVPSEEVRDTPDTDQLLKRKKPPAAFSLTTYAKVPTTPGVFPQWDALMANSYGGSSIGLTIGASPAFAGDTLTITVDGVPTPLSLSSVTTAQSLADLINASAVSTSVVATVSGSTVKIARKPGAGQITVATTATPAELAIGGIAYTLQTVPVDITERLLTIVHGTDNAVDYYRDCLVNNVVVNAVGTDEATLVFSGYLGNSTSMMQTKLGAGGIPAHDAITPVAVPLVDMALQLGPTVEDVAWFRVGTEIFKALSFNPTTKIAQALGGQAGSTPAVAAADAEVFPYLPGPDPDANDHIIGLTLGAWTFDGTAYRVISVESNKDEGCEPRIDEAFESALTGYRRNLAGRDVSGTVLAYQRRSILALVPYAENEIVVPASLRLGPVAGPRIVIDWPRYRLGRIEKGEQASEFSRSFTYMGLASGTPGNDGQSLTVFAQ
jgi:hypothetical protein